jgi:autoinducer 2 (AI-2) kinase
MCGHYLSIDAGTSGGKAAIADESGKIKGFTKKKWSYTSPEGLEPYGAEFDPEQFWTIILDIVKSAMSNAQIDANDIKAISSTSQRLGCVFLDKDGKELYAGPNRDVRGLEIDTDDYMDSDEIYDITGRGLPFMFPLARLLWFQENEEEIFDEIKHLLTIDGWVNFRLTGIYAIDEIGASETLLFDIKKGAWSDKIIDEFEIPREILPDRLEFGQLVGNVSPELSQKLGLKSQTPVFVGGGDSQASLIGCGAIEKGDLGIIAGSTMPLQMVVDKPIIDPQRRIWTNPFIDKKWVIESNAGSAGDVHQWFIDGILTKLGVKDPYEKFEELALSQIPGADGVFADLGTQVFNSQNAIQIPTGGFIFTPMAYMVDGTLDISSFARATVENLSFAVRANKEQIEEVIDYSPSNMHLVGGLSRSRSFCQVLADVLQADIKVAYYEGALVAGFISGMLGTEKYKTTKEAISQVITEYTVYKPDEGSKDDYNSGFQNWKEIYNKSREDSEEL